MKPARFVPQPPAGRSVAYGSHGALDPRLFVLHDTEGGSPDSVVGTLKSRGLGVHWIVGERGGTIRGDASTSKLYHCGAFNSEAIGIEQCGYARYSRPRWMENRNQLLAVAWIMAWECQRHDIPLVLLDARGVAAGSRGVTTHGALGPEGGGHHDPGPGYPASHVMGMARSITERGLGKGERLRVALAMRGNR